MSRWLAAFEAEAAEYVPVTKGTIETIAPAEACLATVSGLQAVVDLPGAPATSAISATSSPAAWADGVARLPSIQPPHDWPPSQWPQLLADAAAFCARWAAQAHSLGWQAWELFGCHRRAPWHRLDGMGLVLALNGRKLVALTSGEAVMRVSNGNCLTHRRRPCDPLRPADRILIWEAVRER